jgi:methylmalonyl-CoA mutase, C-terminal domain
MSAPSHNPQPQEGTRFIPRVLLCKSFIDSHDRAIGTIAKALRDDGMEVIMLEYQVPEQIAVTASQEDVDVVGVSFMSGGQVDVTQRLRSVLTEEGHHDLPVVIGGTIRPFDIPKLEESGVRAIFRGGEPLATVIGSFRELARETRGRR